MYNILLRTALMRIQFTDKQALKDRSTELKWLKLERDPSFSSSAEVNKVRILTQKSRQSA
jgi:hypothetical protein